jgi:hypothetical protein
MHRTLGLRPKPAPISSWERAGSSRTAMPSITALRPALDAEHYPLGLRNRLCARSVKLRDRLVAEPNTQSDDEAASWVQRSMPARDQADRRRSRPV